MKNRFHKQTRRSNSADTGGSSPSARSFFDGDGDGRSFEAEDLIILGKEVLAWIVSWKCACAIFLLGILLAAAVNIYSWIVFVGPLVGIPVWLLIQCGELASEFDKLTVTAILAALVRSQRKPPEIPLLDSRLNPEVENLYGLYRDHEKNQSKLADFAKIALYAIEFAVLIVGGGGLVSYLGVNWSSVLIAIFGMGGVEVGLKLVYWAGERILTPEEREELDRLRNSATKNRTTIKV